MSVAEERYDVFVSYRWREPAQTWVRERLVPALEARGLAVCLDTDCFQLGVALIKEIERAVLASRVTVSVITPAYYESGFTDLEKLMAQHLAAEEHSMRWIAIVRERVDLELLDRFRLALDVTDDEGFDPAVDRLCAAVRDPDG